MKLLYSLINNKQKWIYCLMLYLCCLFYLRDVQEYDIGRLVLIAPVVFSCLVASNENLFYLIALLLPLGWGLSTGYIYPNIILLLLIRKIGPVNKCFVFSFLIGLYELLHYIVYPLPGGRFELSLFSSIICLSFFAAFFVFNERDAFCKDKFVKFFCIGTAIFFVCMLLHSIQIFGLLGVLSGAYRLGDAGIANEMEGTDVIFFRANANYISYYSSACIAFVMLLLRRNTIPLLLGIVLLVVYFCAGFSTQSRTWLLTIFLFFSCYAFSLRKYRFFTLGVIVIICAFVSFIAVQFDDLIEAYKMRFSFDDPNSSMSEYGGRPELIKLFNDYLSTHIDALIWGVGVNGQPLICRIDNGATKGFRAPHNAIQELIVCYGLIGAYVYIVPFVRRIKRLYMRYKPHYIYILPLLMVLIILQTIQILYPPLLIAPLVPAVLILTMKHNKSI